LGWGGKYPHLRVKLASFFHFCCAAPGNLRNTTRIRGDLACTDEGILGSFFKNDYDMTIDLCKIVERLHRVQNRRVAIFRFLCVRESHRRSGWFDRTRRHGQTGFNWHK
jgi:hypothetical protein